MITREKGLHIMKVCDTILENDNRDLCFDENLLKDFLFI